MNVMSNADRYGNELAEAACFFREIAFEIDENPDAITQYLYHSAISNMISVETESCLDRVKTYEALGYGDAGVLLACPGPSLAGVIMTELGSCEQREQFYHYVIQNKARTFLAVTEPDCGSNLQQLKTRVRIDLAKRYRLSGEKWLVGHGATGTIGVVIIRIADGPLGVRALLLTPDILGGVERMVLPMTGLRGARLGRLKFNNLVVRQENLLGNQLGVIERGMMALIKTFNRMRPCVGALALGAAQAILDYVHTVKKFNSIHEQKQLKQLNLSISVARQLLHTAALQFTHNPLDSGLSSLAKVKATRVAEIVAETAYDLLGRYAFIEHPWFEKCYRDVFGFEYMEGTQNIQKINVFTSYQKDLLIQ